MNDQNHRNQRSTGQDPRVPKVCGADMELGNFVLGLPSRDGTGDVASRLLLSQVEGIPQNGWTSSGWGFAGRYRGGAAENLLADDADLDDLPSAGYGYNAQDWARKFLSSNGGCIYIDLTHLELCIPEVFSAFDHVAAWHAMLRIARQAQESVNAKLREGYRVEVLVNNSDGLGSSYGGHLNFLLARRAWDNIFTRKMHYMLYLASYQVSSIVFAGQGKVGAEHGAPAVDYQLSQRADFFETMTGLQTTFRRPLVNSRDEPLCGIPAWNKVARLDDEPGWDLARLHVIFYDNNLCHVACLLKVGVMQILLAMLETGRMNPNLILDDPLDAVVRFSHDPTLRAKARTASGKRVTAVELQLRFLEEAMKFHDRGGCEGIVPRAGEILALYADTLEKLHAGDLDALTGRIDWVLKQRALKQALDRHPGLEWNGPELKHIDHVYSSLDVAGGLYWAYESAGIVQRVVPPETIERFVHQPPDDTRAYTRARLLDLAGPERTHHVDWDSITLKEPTSSGWPLYRTLKLSHPLAMNRAETGHLFDSGATLDEVLEELPASHAAGYVSHTTWTPTTGQSYQQSQPLLPAPHYPTSSGNDSVAVSNYSYPDDEEPEGEGGVNDADH